MRLRASWFCLLTGLVAGWSPLRRNTRQRGLDLNRWLAHVIAAREIGRETVDYVASINERYACRLQPEATQRPEAVRSAA